ncbi:MAG: fasciclin domain-containing protein [Saprospiraceae bacterium]|nr:fasciclin domain-containing protein [Saprospiraceae bacterium]
MFQHHTKLLLAFFVAILFADASCVKDPSDALPSIADLVVSNPDFNTLEDAAIQCNLVFALSNPNADDPSGDFTVFAPNDKAFARLNLLNSDDLTQLKTDFLTQTVLYHVSNGNLRSNELSEGNQSASVIGITRRIVFVGNDRYINGSKIIATDVRAANGTVHVLDKVLLTTGLDIVQSALALRDTHVFKTPELTFLVEAVLYAELAGALSASPGSHSFTVFAPTDAAFRQLGIDLGVSLEVPSDIRQLPKDVVAAVLLHHVVADGGKFTSEMNQTRIKPLGGGTDLSIAKFSNGDIAIGGRGNNALAKAVIPDIHATNGVVHLIDRVLLP